ncbi:Zn-dependent enzyme from deacylase carboxypeptidase superfamily [Seminavis robusta]|uniref:Zn-dependent enzyme from deacylase carboxypeptidase superfamily n=1 Tax=Seminavis robusta TaxID=568900 RepID=A0A9N8DDT4_9STRA|nr:Zn-dependent enzyme from deacylase carboxypeptidase superfamily [Seminavis robusta]|eukprot:Sro101_g051580.1 Zn-dependent enzyme from deacylase carboxypeptidase superfamily (332) ;mRNA; f:49316-50401
MTVAAYPIGTPGVPWSPKEKTEWLESRKIHRSYQEEVLTKLLTDIKGFTTQEYGTLTVENRDDGYPLYVSKSINWEASKPSILVTGGVHGYETSGVQGAIQFIKTKALQYSQTFNVLVVPCVSPWGYECIERWNSKAVDPNRSFNPNGEVVEGRSFNPEPATQESMALIGYLNDLGVKQWMCHFDLHETTDTDNTEFRPSKAARDGKKMNEDETIPDGFYLVSDKTNPQTEWHKAMIDSVRKVTHIAPADPDGTLIGEEVSQEGVIVIPKPSSLGLCMGVTNAEYATTTEVYPDSPKATPEQCNDAQVACIVGGLDFVIQERNLQSCSSTE